MSISVTVTAANRSALVQELQNVAVELSGPHDTVTAPQTDGKKGPGRPPKNTEAAETPAKPGMSLADLGLTPPSAPQAPTLSKVTYSQVEQALQGLLAPRTGDANEQAGMDRVVAVLKKIGVVRVSEIPESKWHEAYTLANA